MFYHISTICFLMFIEIYSYIFIDDIYIYMFVEIDINAY